MRWELVVPFAASEGVKSASTRPARGPAMPKVLGLWETTVRNLRELTTTSNTNTLPHRTVRHVNPAQESGRMSRITYGEESGNGFDLDLPAAVLRWILVMESPAGMSSRKSRRKSRPGCGPASRMAVHGLAVSSYCQHPTIPLIPRIPLNTPNPRNPPPDTG